MTKQNKTQLALLFTGIFLIILTYFYYPNINKNKTSENKSVQKKSEENLTSDQSTTFEKVKYNGLYNLDKTFTVEAEKAYVLNEKSDVIYMTDMHVVLYLNDGRTVNIVSDSGRYNKITYDCFFVNKVVATDGETKIFAENLDLLATKNSVEIYNDVNLNYPTGSLQADKIDYNFETKYFKVSMFDDEAIKMKLVQ